MNCWNFHFFHLLLPLPHHQVLLGHTHFYWDSQDYLWFDIVQIPFSSYVLLFPFPYGGEFVHFPIHPLHWAFFLFQSFSLFSVYCVSFYCFLILFSLLFQHVPQPFLIFVLVPVFP